MALIRVLIFLGVAMIITGGVYDAFNRLAPPRDPQVNPIQGYGRPLLAAWFRVTWRIGIGLFAIGLIGILFVKSSG